MMNVANLDMVLFSVVVDGGSRIEMRTILG